MTEKTVCAVEAGDFRFELKQSEDGTFKFSRSDVSATYVSEELHNVQEIPPTVYTIFKDLMW